MLRYVHQFWFFMVIMAIRISEPFSSYFLPLLRTPSFHLPATCTHPSLLHRLRVFSALVVFHALVLVPGARVVSQVLGFGPQARALALPQVQLQWQAPQWLIRQCRPPLVRRRRVIPAHLITGHNATPSLPRCLTTAF